MWMQKDQEMLFLHPSYFSIVGTVAEFGGFALLWCPSIAAGPEMKLWNRNASKKEGIYSDMRCSNQSRWRGTDLKGMQELLEKKNLEKAGGYNWKRVEWRD